MQEEYIIAHADKSVLRISGIKVKGLNTVQLEKMLQDKLKSFVRIIGVTGENIEADVYNIEPEAVRKNAQGIIDGITVMEGITATELTRIECSEKIVDVNFDDIPDVPISMCLKERWMKK